jgi:hypothetical protein
MTRVQADPAKLPTGGAYPVDRLYCSASYSAAAAVVAFV